MDTIHSSLWLVEEDDFAFLEIYFVEAVDLVVNNGSQRWGDTLLTSWSALVVTVEPVGLVTSIH
jgi:hypothetical protein